MKIADFRIQTTKPDAPSAGVVGLYADASGVLRIQNSAGTLYNLGGAATGTFTTLPNTGGAGRIASGVVFGGGNSVSATGLANPAIWIPYVANGTTYYVPGY